MFTPATRQAVLDQLVAISRELPAVTGLVLVGSGASGFRDHYSDIDVVVAAADGAAVPAIAAHYLEQLQQSLQPIAHSRYEHQPDIWVDCFMLGDLLEVDIGIWNQAKLRATKPAWQLLFARNDEVERRLKATDHVASTLTDSALRSLWIHTRACLVAIRRNHVFKAHSELAIIRQNAIIEVCRCHGIMLDCERRIETLTGPLVALLRDSYPADATAAEMQRALTCAISALLQACAENGAGIAPATHATDALLAVGAL